MVLACLDGDEEGLAALETAKALAARAGLRLVVVRVLSGAGGRGPAPTSSVEWTLRSDSPAGPLMRFIRRNRVRNVVLGERAWTRWGQALLGERVGGFPRVLSA